MLEGKWVEFLLVNGLRLTVSVWNAAHVVLTSPRMLLAGILAPATKYLVALGR